jgi:hypothetical protein
MSLTGPFSKLPPPPSYLYLIHDLVFKEKEIQLDGYHFKNCAFVNCALVTEVGNFKLEECYFQGNWWARFDGNAHNIVRLASIVDWEVATPGVRAVWHPDGAVSIS